MGEKVIVLDRGNVEFLYPGEWRLAKNPQGYLTLTDPGESCRLEVSYVKAPPEANDIPVAHLLKRLLTQIPEAGVSPDIETRTESSRWMAWAESSYPSTDKRSGEAKEARGRWLIASNGLYQLLMTFYYWADDAAWAVPAWSRVMDTIQLGNGAQLSGPEAHWSMQKRN